MINNKKNVYHAEWFVLSMILLFALLLRLYFFVGASIEDDLGFTGNAYDYYRGLWTAGNDQSMRRLTYIPIGILYSICGGMGAFSTHAYHILCGLVTIASAFLISRMLFGFQAAIFSAIFLTVIPIHIIYSTRIMPSLPETAWGGISILLLCVIERRNQKGISCFSNLIYLFIGILIGMAYLCRETGIIFMGVPFIYFGMLMILKCNFSDTIKHALLVISGFSIIFVLESYLNFCLSGDWLCRWHIVKEAQKVYGPPWDFYIKALLNLQHFSFAIDNNNWQNVFNNFSNIIFYSKYNSPLGVMGIFILFSSICYCIKTRGIGSIIIIWFLSYFLFLSFGSSSLNTYMPIRKFHRYEILFLTPASIICGWLMSILYKHRYFKPIVVLLCSLIVISNLYYTFYLHIKYAAYKKGAKEVHKMIQSNADPNIPIFLDSFECAILDYFDGYQSIYRYTMSNSFFCDKHKGVYVVATKNQHGKYMSEFQNKQCLTTIPNSWIKIADVELGYWEYFKPGLRPVLYYIPLLESKNKE